MLAAMFSGRHRVEQDSQGRYFIDRDGKLFHHILTYLRHDKLPQPDMAVDVLEEAEYYQVTGLVDWGKRQDCVVTNALKMAADEAEKQFGADALSVERLCGLATQSLIDSPQDLMNNGENGCTIASVGLAFIGKFKMNLTSSSRVFQDGRASLPLRRTVSCVTVGEAPDHICNGACTSAPVRLIVYDDVVNPVLSVQRAAARFNASQADIQIQLKRLNPSHTEHIAIRSTCLCNREILYFSLKFCFHCSAAKSEHPAIQRSLNVLQERVERLTIQHNGALVVKTS